MAAISTMITAGLAIGGAASSFLGSSKQRAAQARYNQESDQASIAAAAASKEAEDLRRRQAELDNRRRVTQLVRDIQGNRARAVSAAAGMGVLNTSALEGGLGSIASQGGANILAQAQNFDVGMGIFDANAKYAEAGADLNAAKARFGASSSDAQGYQDFGKTLFSIAQPAGRIGGTLFGGSAVGDWTTNVFDAGGSLIG